MAQPTYTGLTEYNARSASAVNAIWNSLATASGSVEEDNLRDEGLDHRHLAANVLTDGRDEVTYYAGGVIATGASAAAPGFVTLVLGATTFTSTQGWTTGQNVGQVRVSFGVEWIYAYAALAGVASPKITFRIEYKNDAGAFATAGVDYPAQAQNFVVTGDNNADGVLDESFTTHWYDSIAIDVDIPFPLDAASHTLNEVRVRIAYDAAAVITFNNAYFRTVRYIKTVA